MRKDVGNTSGLNVAEIRQAIFKLAHFDPTCKDEYGNQVIDYLVLDSLATYGRLVVTALEIKENIKKVLRLDFEEAEINAAARRLAQKGMLDIVEETRNERPRFQILPDIEAKITGNLAEIREMDNKVTNDWKEELCAKYKEYPVVRDNIAPIVENLQLFISKMFIRHGVECTALLYPEEQKTQQWLKSIEGNIVEALLQIDPFIDAIVKLEIPSFFKKPDPIRKVYITNLFNSSFFWHLVQVDEECSKLLREVSKGQILCLDNNILYSLIGLDGYVMLRSVHSMLKLAKALGYELAVTAKTIDEFHSSLDWKKNELKRKLPLPSELARIATQNLEPNSFLTCYWNDFANNGTSIEEFVSEKSHLESVLQGLGIEVTNEFREDIEASQDLLDEEAILRLSTGVDNPHIIKHDAFHRLFISKIRGGPKYHFSEAVAWFLTHDSKLPVYDRVARKGEASLPFCITTDQWVQVNRPLLTRAADQTEYEESFHILVTYPFLRAMMSSFSLEKAYNEVLGRLARYKNMNPQLALNLVVDKHFMFTIASEPDETRIEEKIENKFVDIASQLQFEKDALEKGVEDRDSRLEVLEDKFDNIGKQIEKYETQIKGLGDKVEDEKTKREAAERELKITKPKLEALEAFKAKLVKWGFFAFVIVITSSLLWSHQYWLNWAWLDTHSNKTIIEIVLQALLIFVFLNIPLRRYWWVWLGIVVTLAIAIPMIPGS